MEYVDDLAANLGVPEADIILLCSAHNIRIVPYDKRHAFLRVSDANLVRAALRYPKYQNKLLVLGNDYSEVARQYHPELRAYLIRE